MRISDWSSDVCSSDLRIHLRRGTRRVARDEAPQHGLVVGVANGGEVEQHGEAERRHLRGRRAVMDVPDRILQPRRCIFLLKLAEKRSEERRVGKSVSVRVDLGGRRIIKKKTKDKS